MRSDRALLLRLAFVLPILSACQTVPEAPPAAGEPPAAEAGRSVARPADADRIARLGGAWEAGLAEARRGGFTARIADLGPTLTPASAQPRAAPPPGPYRCRVIRLGAGAGRRPLTVYPSHFCHVGAEGHLLSFTKQAGGERFGGYLFAESDARLIFLGTMMAARDERAPAYGEEEARELAGIVERVGPMRYRLLLPWPRSGATLDIVEFVPAPAPLD